MVYVTIYNTRSLLLLCNTRSLVIRVSSYSNKAFNIKTPFPSISKIPFTSLLSFSLDDQCGFLSLSVEKIEKKVKLEMEKKKKKKKESEMRLEF